MKRFLSTLHRFIFFRLAFLQDELERVRIERDDEIQRLRVEVRLLMDTLLKANGLPAMTPRTAEAMPTVRARLLPSQYRRVVETKAEEASVEKGHKN